ncbi:MAG: hypothetical protein IT350_17485, partial [Deltaproteobacteria bacterium]|nr:hypothetical protein [Deltaproteobacteria bacterium]
PSDALGLDRKHRQVVLAARRATEPATQPVRVTSCQDADAAIDRDVKALNGGMRLSRGHRTGTASSLPTNGGKLSNLMVFSQLFGYEPPLSQHAEQVTWESRTTMLIDSMRLIKAMSPRRGISDDRNPRL